MRVKALALTLALAASLLGQEALQTEVSAGPPEAIISGPREAGPLELVVLTYEAQDGESATWAVDTTRVQVPESDTKAREQLAELAELLGADVEFQEDGDGPLLYLQLPGGVVLANYPGDWVVALGVYSEDGHDLSLMTMVRTGGVAPTPPTPTPPTPTPPGPAPGPAPGPPPVGRFNLGPTFYELGTRVGDPAGAHVLAEALSGIRSEAAAVSTKDAGWMIEQIGPRAAGALSEAQLSQWSAFPVTLETSLDLLASVGRDGEKLQTKADYLDAFEEIEAGLQAVR